MVGLVAVLYADDEAGAGKCYAKHADDQKDGEGAMQNCYYQIDNYYGEDKGTGTAYAEFSVGNGDWVGLHGLFAVVDALDAR